MSEETEELAELWRARAWCLLKILQRFCPVRATQYIEDWSKESDPIAHKRPGSEYVSNHDRGAFGALMAEAKALGARRIFWEVDLEAGPEENRWKVKSRQGDDYIDSTDAAGRTGEEALRRLVEKLRT